MKILSFSALKGGVGKTTILYNFGEFLAQNNKVLLIDCDHQCSLSSLYGYYDEEKYIENNDNSIKNVFENKKAKINKISDNLDIIFSSLSLDEIESGLQTMDSKNYFLWDYIDNNFNDFENYDYILIDCHPDFGSLTKNAIAVSDYIISFIEPSEFGFENRNMFPIKFDSWKNDRSNLDRRSKESLIKGKMIFIANMIKHNTKSSRELLNVVAEDDLIVSTIYFKEIINRSTLEKKSISEFAKDNEIFEKQKLEYILNEFQNLKEYIDNDLA